MPKAKTKTRPHSEFPKGPPSSPRYSVQANSATSQSPASTRVQAVESGAGLPPSSVAVPPASTSQEMSVETVLPSQLLDTLVTKEANKVSCHFVAVPLAQSITPGR